MIYPFSINTDPCNEIIGDGKDHEYMRKIGLPDEWINILISKNIEWISVHEYFWTPNDWFLDAPKEVVTKIRNKTGGSYYSLTLDKQAQIFGIHLQIISARRIRMESKINKWSLLGKTYESIEAAGLDYFKDLGWQGLCDEGAAAQIISWVVNKQTQLETGEPIFGYLSKHRAFKDPISHLRKVEDFLEDNLSIDWLENAISRNYNLANKLAKKKALNHYRLLFNGVGAKFFKELILHLVKTAAPGDIQAGALSGWPDLTLWKDDKIKFVEVKHNDKIHKNQAYWIRNIGKPLNYDISLLKFKEMK